VNREQVETVGGVLAGLVLAFLLGLVVLGLLSSCEFDRSGLGDPPVSWVGEVPPGSGGATSGPIRGVGGSGGAAEDGGLQSAPDAGAPDLGNPLQDGRLQGQDAGVPPAPPSFQTQGAECDPVTGAASGAGGARCGGGYTCEFACPPVGATARPTCTATGLDGRSCAGGPCGRTQWSTGTVKYLACAFGSSCYVPEGPSGSYLLPAGGPGATTRSDGVCRAYCAGDADCGGARGACDHSALPCAPAGTGLCPQGPPAPSCERV
jgi:hypothetical protein